MNEYEQIAIELITYLRDEIPQRELSQSLGYSFNQVGKWESGHTRIKWENFCDLLEFRGVDVKEILAQKVDAPLAKLNYRSDIYRYIIEAYSLTEVIDPIKRKLVRKLINSKNKTNDLATVLELLDLREHMLIFQLSNFFSCKGIPSLETRFNFYTSRLDAIAETPQIPIVRACLELTSYQKLDKHDDEFIQVQSGLSLMDVVKCLAIMKEHQEIEFIDGKYKIIGPGYSFSHSSNPKLRKFNQEIFHRVAQSYPINLAEWDMGHVKNANRSAVFVLPLSRTASVEISELLRHTHGQIHEILKKDQQEYKNEPKENVQLIAAISMTPSGIFKGSHPPEET